MPKDEFIPFIASLDNEYDSIELSTRDSSGRKMKYDVLRGESFLKGSVISWNVLSVVEDSLLMARVGKNSVYNLVKIEVGNASKKEADVLIEKAKKVFKNQESINLIDGYYRSRNNPIAANENIYVPTRNGVGAMTIETHGGDYDLKSALDLDYFRNKLFASLQIPKTYLGFDGEATSILGDNSLARLDERYARSCKRLQNVIRCGITEICKYYLINTGRNPESLPSFKVCMTGISSQEEKVRREELSAKIQNATSVVQLAVDNFSDQINKGKLFRYVFGDMLGLDVSAISDVGGNKVPVKNLGIRGSGYSNVAGDRKFVKIHPDLLKDTSVLDNYDITLDMGGTLVPLKEAVTKYKSVLDEVTYSELKKRVQADDSPRVSKAKKLTTTYLGLNKHGDLLFKTSSGTTPGKFWYQTVRLLDLPKALELFADDGSITDRDIVSLAIHGDLAVYCNDPSFLYYGWQWMATEDEYGIVPETRPPVRNNPEAHGAVCKHLYLVLHVLPFWTNRIVGDLRKQFFRERPSGSKATSKVTYDKGNDQEWKNTDGSEKDVLRNLPQN